VSESPSEAVGANGAHGAASKKPGKARKAANKKLNIFERIALFIRQVIAELRKVVTPTRSELLNYTLVVIVFVMVVMTFVTLLDLGIGKLMFLVFGN
jgi:preprotein translocase subunit SecE